MPKRNLAHQWSKMAVDWHTTDGASGSQPYGFTVDISKGTNKEIPLPSSDGLDQFKICQTGGIECMLDAPSHHGRLTEEINT
jgi:hypothetical protein